jgi:SAM-dependent methyltransferase
VHLPGDNRYLAVMGTCSICGGKPSRVGDVIGKWSGRRFEVQRCGECRFVFVANPWVDYAEIYGDLYYAGGGADPMVSYLHEFDNPNTTIRNLEWNGIRQVVASLLEIQPSTRWLDYGCGTGGLVMYLRGTHGIDAVGHEEGWSLQRLRASGVPLLEAGQLESEAGSFDVITAIEVIEHVQDPVAELVRIRRLLRPGGLLFLTTGNAKPHANDLLSWPYLIPEIHISLFEPTTLARAMEEAGLEPDFPGYVAGWDEIIHFKLLKNLGFKDLPRLDGLVPWKPLARLVDHRYQLSYHPSARRPAK